jgi:hypothetical protein
MKLVSSLFDTMGSMFDSLACMFNPKHTMDSFEYKQVKINAGANIQSNVSYSENGKVVYDGPAKDAPKDVKNKIKELQKSSKDLRSSMADMTNDLFADWDEDEAFKDLD